MTDLERNILKALKNGDEQAFDYLFKTYYKPLYNYACEILKAPQDAEEVVEETFIKLWEAHRFLDVETSIKAYLFRTVYNQSLNIIKHKNVVNKYEIYFKHHIYINDNESANSDFPLSKLIELELSEIIGKAIESLPEQSRLIFKMSRFEMLKNEEIAEKLNISINTVKTHISRSLARLREHLKDYLPSIIFFL